MGSPFKLGDRVRVKTGEPATHCRTPHYLRGKRGRIVREFGSFRDPEKLAYHKPGYPKRALYQVCFDFEEVWGGRKNAGPRDTINADIYEHWLERDSGE